MTLNRRAFLGLAAATAALPLLPKSGLPDNPAGGLLTETWSVVKLDYGMQTGHAVKLQRGRHVGRAGVRYWNRDEPTPLQLVEAKDRAREMAYRALLREEARHG